MTANMGYSQSLGDNRVQERDYTLLFYLLFLIHIQEVQQHLKSTRNTLGWGRKEKKGGFNHDATIFAKTDTKKSNINRA